MLPSILGVILAMILAHIQRKFELNKMRDSSLALIVILQIPTAASEAAARRHARAVAMLAVEATCEYMYTYIILWP